MLIPAIKKITVFYDGDTWVTYELYRDGVTEIIDKSLEYPESLHHIFYIIKGGTLFTKLINVPVIAEHFN